MNAPATTTELIDHILTRSHPIHRPELPRVARLARELESNGANAGSG